MHKQFLLAALHQAKLGRGNCAPNPCVGAVAVQHGKIIAQAYHHGAGSPHAEQLILKQFPANLPGVSLYVTLEPCNHWGKTPPCTDAIINHGIEQVIYGYTDLNPLVAKNNTPKTLRAQGITIQHIQLPEIERFYASYRHWVKTGSPLLTAKMAQTLDGKIAGIQGERLLLSNTLCQTFTHECRAQADVILTSARTIHQDNPELTVRLNGTIEAKSLAILDQHLSLDLQSKAVQSAKHCHIFHSNEHLSPANTAKLTFHPVPLVKDYLDLQAVINALGQLGYHDVFVEAGGRIFSALHRARLVHRTYIYIVPKTLQADAISAYQLDDALDEPVKTSWIEMDNNMILCLDWKEDTCLQA